MTKRLGNENLDPVKALIMAKVAEHKLDLKELSERAGRNVTYLQQFVRKGVPKRLPRDVRDLLASALNVSPDRLGEINQNLRPRDRVRPAKQIKLVVENSSPPAPKNKPNPLTLEDRVLNRGRVVAVFNCPGIILDTRAVNWSERPARFAGVGPLFAIWVPDSVGRLRAGDLAFVQPAQPTILNDTIVVTSGRQIVTVGELIARSDLDVTVVTRAGETRYQMSDHQVMRVAVAVFR